MTLIQIAAAVVAVILLIGGILWFRASRAAQDLASGNIVPNVNLSTSPIPTPLATDEPVSPSPTPSPGFTVSPTPVASPLGSSGASGLALLPETGVSTEGNVVTITAINFSPKTTVIKKGESVTFINADDSSRTISSHPVPQNTYSEVFNTVGTIEPKSKKEVIFNETGTFRYRDTDKTQITGLITVE